jgi:anthranilate phosphoribosyltransferase
MLDRIYNLEEKRWLVDQMLAKATAFLEGQAGPIETARSLAAFRGKDENLDELLLTFVAVDSETDALPLGDVRKLWDAEALKRRDIEIAKAEAWCCEMVSGACRDLVTTLAPIRDGLRDQYPPEST